MNGTPPEDTGTHCEWCGAEYATDPKAPVPAPRAAPARPVPAQDTGAGAEGTHCEWCGAEYPVPGTG